MHQFHLPNPAMVVSHQPAPIIKPELIQLAPILQDTPLSRAEPVKYEQQHFDFSAASRRPSTSSISSSQITYTSRSASPAFSHSGLEPAYGNTVPSNRLHMHERHLQSYPYYEPSKSGIRCPRCLQASETVWVAPGKRCQRCNTPAHDGLVAEPHAAGKASKKKRVDRKMHSRMNNMDPNAPKAPKRDGEAGRRYDHAFALGVLQQTLLNTNPSLVKTAAGSFGNMKSGWSPLKNNNICWDVRKNEGIDPLLYNKMDIFGTSKLIHEQSNTMIEDIVSELLEEFQSKAIARRDPYFARKTADLIKRINKARETRGEDDWVSPKDLRSDASSRL